MIVLAIISVLLNTIGFTLAFIHGDGLFMFINGSFLAFTLLAALAIEEK